MKEQMSLIQTNGEIKDLLQAKDAEIAVEKVQDTSVRIEDKRKKGHIYGVNESPPIYITIICGLQVIP